MGKCIICGCKIIENERNPNIHYSVKNKKCDRCEIENNAKKGSWLQDKNGNYYQKK